MKKKTKINSKGELIVTSERTRSQITNFSDCLQKIRDIIEEVQRKPKEPTEDDKAVVRMRSVLVRSGICSDIAYFLKDRPLCAPLHPGVQIDCASLTRAQTFCEHFGPTFIA